MTEWKKNFYNNILSNKNKIIIESEIDGNIISSINFFNYPKRMVWIENGEYHRDKNLPAVILENKLIYYHKGKIVKIIYI